MPTFVTHALQLLHDKRTEASSSKAFLDVHEDVAIGPVVVKQDAARRGHAPVNLHDAAPWPLFGGNVMGL